MNINKVIKICGLQSIDSVDASRNADFIGFIVGSPRSSRNISLDKFQKLSKRTTNAEIVAVTVNDDLNFIKQVIKLEPDLIQLHGNARKHSTSIDYPFAIGISFDEYMTNKYLFKSSRFRYYSIDSINKNGYGGTGRRWKWEVFKQDKFLKLVAGGINAENFSEALNITLANGIDVSSGVELLGQKSNKLIQQMIMRFRNYDK